MPAAARRRQLARAGVAGADRPLAAKSRAGERRLLRHAAKARWLTRDHAIRLWPAVWRPPQRAARPHTRILEPIVGASRRFTRPLVTSATVAGTPLTPGHWLGLRTLHA